MDIEHYVEIEQSLKNYLNLDIISIIFEYLNLNYNQLQENHIRHNKELSLIVSFQLREQFHIEDHIEFETFSIIDNLERCYHPLFIKYHYNYCPLIDIYFDINFDNFIWEILNLPEPEQDIDYI